MHLQNYITSFEKYILINGMIYQMLKEIKSIPNIILLIQNLMHLAM